MVLLLLETMVTWRDLILIWVYTGNSPRLFLVILCYFLREEKLPVNAVIYKRRYTVVEGVKVTSNMMIVVTL